MSPVSPLPDSVYPGPDGRCPACGAALLLVENVLVRRETPLTGLDVATDGEVTLLYPVLGAEADSQDMETLSEYLSCSGMACAFVFAPGEGSPVLLGEPDAG